jgi:tetratricopeptide (TPR) repeat protein
MFRLIRFTILTCFSGVFIIAQTPAPKPAPSSSAQAQPTADTNADFAEARRLAQQGKYDQAIDKLQALAAKTPPPAGVSHELGLAYYKKTDYLKAAEYLKQATAENPNDKEAVQLLGLSYYLAGRPAEAIPYLEKVQAWYPRANVDASYVLGISYIQNKDYPNARKAFATMFDVPPESGAAYLVTARMLFRQEFLPIAEEYAEKAIAADPKLPLAHQLLGEVHMYMSKIPEAISDFQHELAINPANASVYYKLGDAYLRVQKYDDAQRQLQRSLWLDASSTGPYILMGKVLQKKGEPMLALRALLRAANMDPNNPMTHQLLGQAYRDMGKADDAERELKIAEQLRNQQSEPQ